ncbi:hypothetical protein GLYMA_10G207600v4 [Glycine max]|uniref:Uncharacterized protein n=2 Tax=Glycine subgen. Soja TaxID=1462606 RepID=I1LCW4_SOYBN|nr:uncharacterized protein LOC100807152 isoform X1 [Glycine max]XP_028185557.1 uncharacterized protein LOC114372274 isoform X1 [Glycine soja]KAH1139278.1 hypothetical protein GYH30_028633 [Glycine max]KRH34809.1 hypothetical protein GLYMA_10G207600v4 [Glycine max]|eukprot:XP_006589402.1 uncharacterized protein LOC100807152 isoform X1 [Glycine max]
MPLFIIASYLRCHCNRMHEFSIVDGFVEISECMAEMTKYVANEPSVGLFFIQQHAQNAVPNIIKVKKNVVEKSHETTLHTEDLEDSVTMVQSMKECGFPIADKMIREIKKSLITMETKQPKRGLIHPASSSHSERASFLGNAAFYAQEGNEKRSNYFSNVLKSAKEKAGSFKWRQLDTRGSIDSTDEKPPMYPNLPLLVTSASITSSFRAAETDELPVSSQVEDESQHKQTDVSDISINLLSVSERFDDFKANKEAKLAEWLDGTGNLDDNCGTGDEKRS